MPVSTLRTGPNVTDNSYCDITDNSYCISVIKSINTFVLHPGEEYWHSITKLLALATRAATLGVVRCVADY